MSEFNKILTTWFQNHKRLLPWRGIGDPYKIWVSEVILQQTRVDQGTDYYHRFIDRFPNLHALAESPEIDVLKVWQGLGYYSRARNMHAAARQIVENHQGVFPSDYANLVSLKGIGSYTAAAIASIAFNLPHAAIDGNVYRTYSRIFGIDAPIDTPQGKKIFTQLAQELLDAKNPGTFNEALMEFGALQCIPRSPDCLSCPFNERCVAHKKGIVNQLPVKSLKTKVKERYFYYLFIRHHDHFYLEPRIGKDIWRHLYQFPLIEAPAPMCETELLLSEPFQALRLENIVIGEISPTYTHLLSHQRLQIRFVEIHLDTPSSLPNGSWIRVHPNHVEDYPIPKIIDQYLSDKSIAYSRK